MNILGIGAVSTRGVGVAALENALAGGWLPPTWVAPPRPEHGPRPAYLVDLDAAPDRTLLKKIRRADRLSKMCVLAASGALADAGVTAPAAGRLGIILATAFGAHVTTFDFLDGILDFGDAQASPTAFSNSVHNAAASYVSMSLNIQGPTLTVTRFSFAFQSALQLAVAWLAQGRCDYLLVGAAEQYGDVLGYAAENRLKIAADGRVTPFDFGSPGHVPGEGALFLLLSAERTENAYCSVSDVYVNDAPGRERTVDMEIIDAGGMLPDETGYLSALSPGVPVTAYSPLFGSMLTGSAFNLAAGALMLKRQATFAAPVPDNPHGLLLVDRTGPVRISTIRSVGLDCHGEKSVVYLSASQSS